MPNKPENTYRIKRHDKSIIIIYNLLIYNYYYIISAFLHVRK